MTQIAGALTGPEWGPPFVRWAIHATADVVILWITSSSPMFCKGPKRFALVVLVGGREYCAVEVATAVATAGPWEAALPATDAANTAAAKTAVGVEVLRWLRRLQGRWGAGVAGLVVAIRVLPLLR
jgi:hypothetical protein